MAVTEQRVKDLEAPATAESIEGPSPTLERLDSQIAWYDAKSRECQYRYKGLKAVVIGGAAAIPVVAAFDVPVYVAGILGAVVVVVEACSRPTSTTRTGSRTARQPSRSSTRSTSTWPVPTPTRTRRTRSACSPSALRA